MYLVTFFYFSSHCSCSPIFFFSIYSIQDSTFSLLPFSPTIRKSPLWCAWWRGLFSLRWWLTTSISSRLFAYTMCQVNTVNCTMESVQIAFSKAFYIQLNSPDGTILQGPICGTKYNSVRYIFPPISLLFFTCSQMQNNICKLHFQITYFPIRGLSLVLLWFCVFRGGWVFYRHHHHGGHQRSDQ